MVTVVAWWECNGRVMAGGSGYRTPSPVLVDSFVVDKMKGESWLGETSGCRSCVVLSCNVTCGLRLIYTK